MFLYFTTFYIWLLPFNDIKTGLFFSKQDVYCKYSMYLEADLKTEVISGTRNPEFNYERTFSFERVPPKVTQSFRSFKLNASSFNSTFETREPNSFIGTMYHLKVLLCTVHFRVSWTDFKVRATLYSIINCTTRNTESSFRLHGHTQRCHPYHRRRS